MNPNDGWVNFSDYLDLNREASQRQLQTALDARQGDADAIRTNADRNFNRAYGAGFEGNTADYGRGADQQQLAMSYGNFVEGLSDPSRLEAYFQKAGAGGNSMLDAGLASVAGGGQIQEAQKGLAALRNYITEREVDTQARVEEGQQGRERANAQEAARKQKNAQWFDIDKRNSENQRAYAEQRRQADIAFADDQKGADNPFAQPGAITAEQQQYYKRRLNEFDPTGRRFGAAPAMNSFLPSWAKPKPGGF